ncbi:DUF3179 domain-containing protein [Marinilongibacter aquaticus]|uniref:DUF3179 domain-containing protein n=1 Tax=Marinilongibacter aquaticus TaxID=2975157 RepID=UPI0021BD8C4A|nr:DUF3179 domain-containing protein [Marinilongibacter aquaticus]UBM59272.1 DUF3179 domain-containing protein [Marinilongibacter aquaticus]
MKKIAFFGVMICTVWACKKDEVTLPSSEFFPGENAIQEEWGIPLDEIVEGQTGKDGIVSIDEPIVVSADSAGTLALLQDNDVVLGIWSDTEARAYPQKILNYHEVINDRFSGENISVTYAVLTGSGVVFRSGNDFGVSGLVYNSNSIYYDKESSELWSQLKEECINGAALGASAETIPFIQVTWGEWKKWFPETTVVVYDEENAIPDYDQYPYGDYLQTDSLLFPLNDTLSGFPLKEEVLAVWGDSESKVLRFQDFGSSINYQTFQLDGQDKIAIGSIGQKFMCVYNALSENGDFIQVDEILLGQEPGMLLRDTFGSVWNIRGEAVSGSRKGDKIEMPKQQLAYAFALNAFYPQLFE